ncbi:MAG: hypothetical protein U0992_06685 [Planctomycetaceae bacterium]
MRKLLDTLPPPAGTSRLAAAVAEAAQSLAITTNAVRHIIVLTDGQALPWLPEHDADWTRFTELQRTAAIPLVFAVDVTAGADRSRTNVLVPRVVSAN